MAVQFEGRSVQSSWQRGEIIPKLCELGGESAFCPDVLVDPGRFEPTRTALRLPGMARPTERAIALRRGRSRPGPAALACPASGPGERWSIRMIAESTRGWGEDGPAHLANPAAPAGQLDQTEGPRRSARPACSRVADLFWTITPSSRSKAAHRRCGGITGVATAYGKLATIRRGRVEPGQVVLHQAGPPGSRLARSRRASPAWPLSRARSREPAKLRPALGQHPSPPLLPGPRLRADPGRSRRAGSGRQGKFLAELHHP